VVSFWATGSMIQGWNDHESEECTTRKD
jgi:hypothetical protein